MMHSTDISNIILERFYSLLKIFGLGDSAIFIILCALPFLISMLLQSLLRKRFWKQASSFLTPLYYASLATTLMSTFLYSYFVLAMLNSGKVDADDDNIGMGLGVGVMILWWMTFWTFVIAYIIAFVIVSIYNKKIRNKNVLDNIGSLQNFKRCIYMLFAFASLFILIPIITGLIYGLDIKEFNISDIFIGLTLFAVSFSFIVVFKLQKNQSREIEKLKNELTLFPQAKKK